MAGPSGAPPSRTYGLGAGVRVNTVSSSGAERRARGIADGFLEVAGIRRPWGRSELIHREKRCPSNRPSEPPASRVSPLVGEYLTPVDYSR